MTLQEYVDQVKLKLGYPAVDLEIARDEYDGMMEKIIKSAFIEIREYIDTAHYVTVSASTGINGGVVDMSEHNVRAVLYVARGTVNYSTAGANYDALLWSPLTMMQSQSINYGYNEPYRYGNFIEDYAAALTYKQIRNSVGEDLDYTYDCVTKQLYLYQQIPTSSSITICYNKLYSSVEEIVDPYWINLFLRMCIAYAKEVEGRIRSKYTQTSAPYTLDGTTLLSESQAELTDLREYLNKNNNIFIPRS